MAGWTIQAVPGAAHGLNPPSTALDATNTIWEFFAQHHL
ncbi:hypothetical protein MYIN104542_01065 [Mycobacterium intermedium]